MHPRRASPASLALAVWPLVGCGGEAPAARPTTVAVARGAPPCPPADAPCTRCPPPEPPSSGVLGTAHPVRVVAAAPDGRWAVLCQARSDTDGDGEVSWWFGHHGEWMGDRTEPYLVRGSGEGERLERVVDVDPAGRHLVALRGGRLWLLDPLESREIDLSARGADARADGLGSGWKHRAASFDPTGERLVYLRGRGAASRVVVRTLASGDEIEINPGPGALWRARFDAKGDQVLFAVVSRDRDGNGALDWPARHQDAQVWPGFYRPANAAPCGGPRERPRNVWRSRPADEVSVRVAPATGGAATEVDGMLMPFGDGLLRRDASGAIRLLRAEGETELVPATCKPTILAVTPAWERVLVACDGGGDLFALKMYERSGTTWAFKVDVPRLSVEAASGAGPSLVEIPTEQGAILFDLARGKPLPLGQDERVHVVDGRIALVQSGKRLLWRDADSGVEKELDVELADLPTVHRAGRFTFVEPAVVEVPSATLVGVVREKAYAIATSGYVLVREQTGRAWLGSHVAPGPLRWRWPSPP